ncbi:MAG: hypothetical protein L0229_29045 [Blastocatellia bacterium]|nr:hypothetical protein [Blastocatellia bacterium]
MSSPSQSTRLTNELGRAARLKHELAAFATKGQLKEAYEWHQQMAFSLSKPVSEREEESVLDWFLFEWMDDSGGSAIEHFLEAHPDLSDEDQNILIEWEDSFNGIFEIRSLGKNSLRLRELETGDLFPVNTVSDLNESPFKRGQFIATRLLPLGERFIFASHQLILPDKKAALEMLEIQRALDEIGSPEAIEQGQQEQCMAFCELFGCEELTVSPEDLNSTLERLQKYMFFERRDKETGETLAEKFQTKLGVELQLLDMPELPGQTFGASDVTILCDEFDGIVVLPDYNRFKRVFESDRLSSDVPEWRELVWNYIKNPDIPTVAFERVAEQYPERIEKVFRSLLGDKKFSIEHLYAVVLHYKQPVEGLDHLDDDRRLWDLFNGNSSPAPARAASSAKAKSKAAGKTPAKKKTASAKSRKTAKKTASSKTGAKAAKATGGRGAGKSAKSKAGAKTKAKSSGKARKGAAAKKR